MIISELFPSDTGRNIPELRGKLEKRLAKSLKFVKAKIKRARRLSLVYVKKQYSVSLAIRDVRSAAQQNEDILIAATATVGLLAYGITVMAARFLLNVFTLTYAFSEAMNVDMLLVTVVIGGVILASSLLLTAFCMNFVSYALMDGANRKVHKSIRSTVRKSMRSANRVVLAWLLYGLMILSPAFAMGILTVMYYKWATGPYVFSPVLLTIIVAMWAISTLAIMITYSLVPAVALFEPNLLLFETLGRSRYLTKKCSRPFLVSALLGLVIYSTGLYALCQYLSQFIGRVSNLLFAIGMLVSIIALNSVLTMLYRKRKLARS